MAIIQNTFNGGLNQDVSDLLRQNTTLRGAKNVRIIDLDSSTFAVTLVDGTEEAFTLTPTYIPIQSREYNNILYIVSIEPGGTIEIGSYPSPDYAIPTSGNYNVYRPFNNLEGGAFQTSAFGYSKDDFLDLVIQPEYDNSANVIIIAKDHPMRIVNSKFERIPPEIYTELPDRAGDANSNTYTTSSLDKETSLILNSNKILKIDYNAIEDGGQLTYGNYVYVFEYMTEDFNATDVVGQSSICSVFSGDTANNIKGGFQNDQANKLVKLDLSNVDTDFRYFRVYFKYSSGTRDAEYNAVFEMTTPIPITGETMTFIHSGFEETIEVDESVINLDASIIDSAATGEAIGGFLMLGDIVERAYDYTDFKTAALAVTMSEITSPLPMTGEVYGNPKNVYESLGYFGGETYPWAMVFILLDGKLTPPFPVTGYDMLSADTDKTNPKGLFRHSNTNSKPINTGLGDIIIKHVEFNLSNINLALLDTIKENSLGYFFVRGERKPDLITQALLIPTLRVPPLDAKTGTNWHLAKTYYLTAGADESAYRFIPCVDNLLEAYTWQDYESSTLDSKYVVDDRNQLDDGYMPIFVNDKQQQYVDKGGNIEDMVNNYSLKHWALIPGDSLINNPEAVSQLNGRSGIVLHQLGKINFAVKGAITPLLYNATLKTGPADINVGLHYEEKNFTNYLTPALSELETVVSVSPATYASGSSFISKMYWTLFQYAVGDSSTDSRQFDIAQDYNDYFGVTLSGDKLAISGDKNIANPIAGNARRTSNWEDHHVNNGRHQDTPGIAMDNLTGTVPAGFLVNLYQNGQRTTAQINDLYATLTGVIYNQVGQRYEWEDLPTSKKMQIYGGDCYVSKIHRRLNQSGYPNPFSPFDRRNIDAGQMMSWWQESKYNLNLRVPFRFDANEVTDRTFYPFEGGGNFEAFRQYRLPETIEGNKGYSVTDLPKSFIPVSELAPVIRSSFFSRVHHSARHIPNAFANGYRIFEGLNFRDYDTAMGSITMILNHRGNMIVIFEHGIGVTSIEQRVQTGEDFAGQIFVKPSDILPPTLQFYSRDIGCQQPKSIIQTPSSIYGIDADKHKIWQIAESLTAISEDGLSSFMAKTTFNNPRSGYDFEFNEVIFTTDDWTLCFREGMEKFTSFYTHRPSHYATRSDEFYSFHNSTFNRHNANTKTIYGNIEESYIEFTINEGASSAKVHDYINIISNEVEAKKVEFFTYADRTYNSDVVELAKVQQYTVVEQGIDPFTDEDKIRYRDKKFVVQIPNAEIYNKKDETDDWEKDGRMRNKYLIVRLTYETEDYLHLIAILTSIRQSRS